jgi:hypothetical protein
MRSRILSVFPIVASALIFLAPPAQMRADTIFSNFGPGQSFTPNSYWSVGNTPGFGTQVDAFSFSPTETATLTSVDLALFQIQAPFSPVNVYIESSVGGAPGVVLDTLTQVGTFNGAASIVDFTCATCSVLDSGDTYWIVAQQSDPSAQSGWFYSPTDTGTWYYNETGSSTGPWSTATAGDEFSAFDVNGSTGAPVIPEPASLILLGSGLAGLLAVKRWGFVRRA